MSVRVLPRLGVLDFLAAQLARVPKLVVIAGKEHMLADEVIRKIVNTVAPDESLRPLNVDTIDARTSDDFALLPEKLGALPFLSDRRVVTVRGVVELRNEERKSLKTAIPEIGDHAVLVIDDSGEARPVRGKAPKDKVDAPAFAAGQGDACLVDTALSERDRERYIDERSNALGVTVEAGARKYLAAFDSVNEITNALDRLALVGKKITKAAAEEYVAPPGDPKLWDLGNAVSRQDTDEALLIARELVAGADSAAGPLIWLAGDAQIVWELSSGANPDAWAAATGQSAFRAIKLWDSARKGSPRQARDKVRLTMKALDDSLTGKRVPEQALEEIIVRLCSQK